jgi:glycosyltransferase involved in cell wall biosynthesis
VNVLMITQQANLDHDILGFTHTWVNKLAERVDTVHLLLLWMGGRYELADNVKLYSMGKERGTGRLGRFVNFNRVVAPLVLHRQVDAVFVHMCPIYAVLVTPWAKLARVPVIMWYTHRNVTRTLKLAHRLVDRVVTASTESFRIPSDKVLVTGHGIDTDVFKPAEGHHPERPFTVLSVGRISPIKDYETLIKAADILVNQQRRRDLQFVVVGDVGTPEQVSYREQLLADVRWRRLTDRFEFVGAVPHQQVVSHYQQADLFVNLSHTDSLDKAVLEAMACGVVPLTSNPAFGPLLGTLAPRLMFTGRDARDLAGKIGQLARLSEIKRGELGKELRSIIIQQHSVQGLMHRLVELWSRSGR